MGRKKLTSKGTSKKPDENELFDVFWKKVREVENEISRSQDKSCLPPDAHDDPLDDWSKDFFAAYDAIRKFLKRSKNNLIFLPPSGMKFRPAPLTTETAHQALLWFLAPPKELYGFPNVLESVEYMKIKEAALEERRLRAINKAKGTRAIYEQKRLELSFVLDDHIKAKNLKPLTIYEMQDKLRANSSNKNTTKDGWSYASIWRILNKMFGGIDGYHELFKSDKKNVKGHATRSGEDTHYDRSIVDSPDD